MALHYLVKIKIRVFFVKILMPEKRNTKNFLIDSNFAYLKGRNSLTLTLRYNKFNQENMYQTLSESGSFCKRYDRNILLFFVHSSNCCSLAKREC